MWLTSLLTLTSLHYSNPLVVPNHYSSPLLVPLKSFGSDARSQITNNLANNYEIDQLRPRSGIVNPSLKLIDPRSINKAIVETFNKQGYTLTDVERLKLYVHTNVKSMNQINVITLMHRCAKNKHDVFDFLDIDTIVELLDVNKSGIATAQGIANAVYSIQSMTSSTPGFSSILTVLTEQLLACREIFDGQAISNTLYGLKGMTSESLHVRKLLQAIVNTVKYGILNQSVGIRDDKRVYMRGNENKRRDSGSPVYSLKMTPQGIGSAFIGLQGMSSSNVEVKFLLSLLAKGISQLTAINGALDSQAVANILVGLRSSSSEHSEVREVLVALCKNLSQNPAILRGMKSRELSMTLQGMQGMSSEIPQVDKLLELVCDGLDDRLTSDLLIHQLGFQSGDELGAALGGLKQMSAENLQVRRLLRHLGRAMIKAPSPTGFLKVKGKKAPGMNEQNIANSLYGFQSMDCRREEVRVILAALAREILLYEGKISGRTVANALYGLQCMTASTDEVKAVLKALTKKIDRDATDYTGQHIAMALYGLQWMSANGKEMECLINVLADRIEATPVYLSGTHLASAVYGMQSMSSNFPYVRRLVKALADKMPEDAYPRRGGWSDTSPAAISPELNAIPPSSSSLSNLPNICNKDIELCISGQETAMMMHGMRCMGSEWAQVQDMLTAITYRMRQPSIRPQVSTLYNITNPINSVSSSLGSPFGSGKATEPGPEIGGTVISTSKTPSSISGSSQMTAKELSRAINGLQNMGRGRMSSPIPLQRSITISGGVSYNILPVLGVDGEGLGKKRQRIPLPLLSVLSALADRLEARAERLSGPMVATAVYGLQGLSADIPPVRKIVRILAADLGWSSTPLDGRNMGNIMYGMQKMTITSRNKQVKELLSSISKAFKMTPYPLSAQAVGNCFYGLQGMSSEIPEVREIIRALAVKVNDMPLAPSAQKLKFSDDYDDCSDNSDIDKSVDDSNETYRINEQSRDTTIKIKVGKKVSEEGERFLSPVFSYMMTGQNIGNALWGLRNTTSRHEEVREALAALSVKISQSYAELNGQDIGNALYSLHAMDGEAVEVRAVLRALAQKIVTSRQPLSGLDIGMSLFGLRSMDAEIPEVRAILGTLIVKIRSSDCEFKLKELSMAIIGVLNATPWIRDDFLNVLASKTPGMSKYEVEDLEESEKSDKWKQNQLIDMQEYDGKSRENRKLKDRPPPSPPLLEDQPFLEEWEGAQ